MGPVHSSFLLVRAGDHVTASPASPLQLSRWAYGLTSRLFQINWLPAAAATMASAVNTVQPAASSLLSPPRLTAHCQAGLGGPVRCLHSSTADSRARGYVTTWHSAYVSVLLSTGGVTNFDNDTVKAYLLTYWSSHTLGIFAKSQLQFWEPMFLFPSSSAKSKTDIQVQP